jgi:excisionase family DNA binding protein
MSATGETLLTLAQVGERLQVGRTSVHRIIAEGGLRRVKFGKIVRVRETDLQAWLEKHASESNAGAAATNREGENKEGGRKG